MTRNTALKALACLLLLWSAAAYAQTATTQVKVLPNAGAYSAGNCLGGVLTIPGMVRAGHAGGTILAQVDIVDPTGANAAVDILFFNAAPTGTYTDHTACNVAVADQPFLVGTAVNTGFTCVLDQSVVTGLCQGTPTILITPAVLPAKTSNLWAVPIMRGTPTYGAGVTLYFNFKAFPD